MPKLVGDHFEVEIIEDAKVSQANKQDAAEARSGRTKVGAIFVLAAGLIVVGAQMSEESKGPFGSFFVTPDCGGGCDEPASYDW